jgi:hypothetical protein
MDANLRESWRAGRLGRYGVRFAPRSNRKETNRDVFGETPKTSLDLSSHRFDATRTIALPKDWISKYSRLFESIRGSICNSLICRQGLTQVVDFHDISTYFHVVPLASMAGSAQVPKGSETAYATR